MAHRITLTLIVSTVLALSFTCTCMAQESQRPRQLDAATQTGIDTSRLSRAQLRVWKSILEIVMAQDKEGRPLYPTLNGLYRQVETSGHLIRIDLSKEESLTRAGRFTIEALDPEGVRHLATIRLNLATIERAHVETKARYSNGLIPFAGLTTKQRYAEVLGHELGHAAVIFQNAESLRLHLQIEKEAAGLDASGVNAASGDLLKRLENLNRLMRENEKPAEAAELEVWRELHGGASLNPRISAGKRYEPAE